VVTIPHLGASTEESEDNCAVMAAKQLDEYLKLGNIKNSVNYPAVSMSPSGSVRLCVLHANIPAVLTNITGACAAKGINIENMMNKSRGENAYTMLDVNSEIDEEIITSIYALDGVRRVRVIKF
jgi:D-3-phosphoglycerate dehydrogenase